MNHTGHKTKNWRFVIGIADVQVCQLRLKLDSLRVRVLKSFERQLCDIKL